MASIRSMPLLQLQTSVDTRAPEGLLETLSRELARSLAKPEAYVMVTFEGGRQMLFAGTSEPACFAVLKSIGTFTPAQTDQLSGLLTARLSAALGVAPGRIYIEFVDAKPHLWGHDGGTFA
jgi:phenylpyruvate tautomerase